MQLNETVHLPSSQHDVNAGATLNAILKKQNSAFLSTSL